MSGITFGKSEQEKQVDRLEDLFWEANKGTLDKKVDFDTAGDRVGAQRKATWTWRTRYIKARFLEDHGLDVADMPEEAKIINCITGEWNQSVKLIQHRDWDHWEFDVGQMPARIIERDDDAPVIPGGRRADRRVYFNHLPEGYREFPNRKAAREYIRRNHPGNDLNM